MRIFYTFLIIAFTSTLFFGQGAYLDRGQSAIGLGAGFTINGRGQMGIGSNLGYSVSGLLDFGIGVDRFYYNEKSTVTTIYPNVAFYALKQSDDFPLSVAFSTAYSLQNYSNYVTENNFYMTGNSLSFNLTLSGYFQSTELYRIQPFIGFGYVTGSVNVEDKRGNSLIIKDDVTGLSFGIQTVNTLSNKNVFVISPRILISEGKGSCDIVLIYIIGT